jgi:formylglycine-generating enzyme required for sulfatase activity
METNRIYRKGFAALALILTLAACTDLTGPGTGTGSGETIPPGMGLARIRLGIGGTVQSIRTIRPEIGGYYFTLKFTAPEKAPVNETLNGSESLTLTVALEPAVWNLEVKGYEDNSMSTPKVKGNISVSIIAGTSATFSVSLAPDFSSGGTGTLVYNISFPSSVRGWFGLYPIDNTPGLSQEIDISSNAGGTASDTITGLPEGSYRAIIDLYNSTSNEAAVWTEAVHIYDGSATSLPRTFSGVNFAPCPDVIGSGETTLADKLDAALAAPADSYTIVLDGAETDLISFTPKTLNATGNKNITIRGNGNTVQLASPGSLFTLGAGTGSSLTLTIQDVTLRGLSSNSNSLVQVNSGGILLMKAGSLITGNTTSGGGGGVTVDSNGTFTMSGGAVSGNTTGTGGGGGVNVDGTFTMSGGAVSGNIVPASASADGSGGVFGSGTFNMSGGAVSGNESRHTSSFNSGGVFFYGGGTFTMSGGAVSGNNSNSNTGSGGVFAYASAKFIMNGGVVRGNTSRNGGGAYSFGGTVTINGGKMSGNIASSNGGGVYIYSGTVTMSGGEMSRNTASSNGGGVYISGGTFTMNGGEVSGNIISGANSFAREVLVSGGTFSMSGAAWPERVSLNSNTQFITISGPLSGGTVPIDLGITSSAPLVSWENQPILKRASSYSEGNLASLKDHFALGNSKRTDTSDAEEPIPTDYEISDEGKVVVPGNIPVSDFVLDLRVAAPVKDAAPDTTPIDAPQYTGSISWQPNHSIFAPFTTYQAMVNLAAKTGHTFTGVGEDSFTYLGATVTNPAGSGNTITVTISFPKTAIEPVTDITGVPTTGTVGIALPLGGTVVPGNATNQTIVWSVKTYGGTGASISGSSLATSAAGTVEVTATIADGTAVGTPYTQDFSITITILPAYNMVSIPAGTVDSGMAWGSSDDYPLPHTVSAFYIGETEITYELWYAVRTWATAAARGANVYTFADPGREGDDGTDGAAPTGAMQEPVTYVSWWDAVVWCNAYSEAAGKTPVYKNSGVVLRKSYPGDSNPESVDIDSSANGFRLPTEAEWEYAARGGAPGTTAPWTYTYAGSNTVDDVAVYDGSHTAAVRTKAANSCGLYDMSGNVFEWCQDASGTSGINRVFGGGSWDGIAFYCTVPAWGSGKPIARDDDMGFRVVCDQ